MRSPGKRTAASGGFLGVEPFSVFHAPSSFRAASIPRCISCTFCVLVYIAQKILPDVVIQGTNNAENKRRALRRKGMSQAGEQSKTCLWPGSFLFGVGWFWSIEYWDMFWVVLKCKKKDTQPNICSGLSKLQNKPALDLSRRFPQTVGQLMFWRGRDHSLTIHL